MFQLQGGVGDWPRWAQRPGMGSHWPEPLQAVAGLALTAASVLVGENVEAPPGAGNAMQLVAGRWQTRACHCCCWEERW